MLPRARRASPDSCPRVIEPAVIGAGDPALLHPAVQHRRSAVRAVVLDQTPPGRSGPEEHQVLLGCGRIWWILGGQLLGHRDGVPVASQQLAAGCGPTCVSSSFSCLVSTIAYFSLTPVPVGRW